MEPKRRTMLLLALGLASFVLVSFFAWRAVAASRPSLTERWALYVEEIQLESKLVVLSSQQRYTASKEFTGRLLAIMKISASIELTAWADVFYYVDAEKPEKWNINWDKKSRILSISAPEPDCLPPAVRTETIEITTKGGNLVSNAVFRLKKEAESMQDELSKDLLKRAKETLSDSEIREKLKDGLAGMGKSFCLSILGVEPENVVVRFDKDKVSGSADVSW
ncbi:MAG: hypothetical protein RBT72_06760 [Spirochaetia bacterium]|jgi:hypothetical protein|nr:hypothetical protein [Spirochaetia bacterium]